MELCQERKLRNFKPWRNPINRHVVMMVLKKRWILIMAKIRDCTDYCVYVDVANSFLVVIIKLKRFTGSLRYLKKQHHLAMSILEDK